MKIFIIGGAGFIGSHLVSHCLKNNYEVAVYDNFSVGKKDFLPLHSNIQVFTGDILDSQFLSDCALAFKPDVVYHLAAIHHIPTCEKNPQEALKVNVEGTQNVLNTCLLAQPKRLIFASSGAVYDTCDTSLTEDFPLQPRDIYGISKLCGEQLVQYFSQKSNTETIVVRLFNTVGTNETNAHLIPDIMAQLVEGKRQIVLGNLHTYRDYIHVDDVAQALLNLSDASIVNNCEFFNIGSGKEYSVTELVELCAKAIGEAIEIVSDPNRRRKVDRPSQLADISKIQQATGWQPTRSLELALRETWEEAKMTSKLLINTN
jgi:UDP-glucose 4-epimerase